MAEDFGNIRASAKYIAAQVWQDTTRAPDAFLALEEMRSAVSPASQRSLVQPYLVKGQRYAHIKGFQRHQRQDNASTKPRVPGPEESDAQWFPEVDPVFAAKSARSRRTSSTRGESGLLAALTSDRLPPITESLPPFAAAGAVAPLAAGDKAPPTLSISDLTEAELAVHSAIVDDESLRPIVRAPLKLAQDLVRVAPGIDVPAAVRKAAAWLRANPSKRKSNGARFLLTWATREQDERGGRGHQQRFPPRSGQMPIQPPAKQGEVGWEANMSDEDRKAMGE